MYYENVRNAHLDEQSDLHISLNVKPASVFPYCGLADKVTVISVMDSSSGSSENKVR